MLPSGFSIRPAVLKDKSQLLKIEAAVSPYPWTGKQFVESLAAHRSFVLCKGTKVIGFLVFNQVLDEAELLNIAVKVSFQGEGLGACLLDFCVEHITETAQHLFLEVRASNFPAIALYQGRGFQQVGIRRAYYHDEDGREDALIMRYDIF